VTDRDTRLHNALPTVKIPNVGQEYRCVKCGNTGIGGVRGKCEAGRDE
jgi:hypothetical protein